MLIQFIPQLLHLIPAAKSVSRILLWGSLHSCQLPTWPHTIISSARVCFSPPEIQTQSSQKRELISFQSTLISMESTDLLITIYLSSPEQHLFCCTHSTCWSATGIVHFAFLQQAGKWNPWTKENLKKQFLRHISYLFSSAKWATTENHLWPFLLKHLSKFNAADPRVIWRVFTHHISNEFRRRSWCPFIQFLRNWDSLFLQEQTKQSSAPSRS